MRLVFGVMLGAGMLSASCATEAPPPAKAEYVYFVAKLAPIAGVDSLARGSASFTYNTATKSVLYAVSYNGLSSPLTYSSVYASAEPGQMGPQVFPLIHELTGRSMSGSASITAAQLADMKAGKYHVILRTEKNREGELTGQIVLK